MNIIINFFITLLEIDLRNIYYLIFLPFLNISKENIIEYVQKCSNSIQNINAREYGKNQKDKSGCNQKTITPTIKRL